MTEPNADRVELDELNTAVAEITTEWEAARATSAITPALADRIRDAARRVRDLLDGLPGMSDDLDDTLPGQPGDLRESMRASSFYLTQLLRTYVSVRPYHGLRALHRQLIHALALATTYTSTGAAAATPVNPLDVSDCERVGRVVFVWDGHLVTASLAGLSLGNRGVNATHPVTGRSEHKGFGHTAVVAVLPHLPPPACPACAATHAPVERPRPTASDLMGRITTALSYLADNEDGSFTETVIEVLRGDRTE
jgi:hypothetical protein